MYLLDANVYITACKQYYQFGVVPKFWKFLADEALAARIRTIDKVRSELLAGTDDLVNWVKARPLDHFESCDRPEVTYAYQRLQKWAQNHTQFRDSAKEDFAKVADAWLVAHALACGHTVVTHERFAPDSKKSIKIPFACKEFQVPCIDPFKMIADLKANFS
jgi:hypothetical protein